MFEFLVVTRSYLLTTCHQCREWIASSSATANTGSSCRQNKSEREQPCAINEQNEDFNGEKQDVDPVTLLQNLVLAVQRVMHRHKKFDTIMQQNSEDLLEIPCCQYLHVTSTDDIKDMKTEKVLLGFQTNFTQFCVLYIPYFFCYKYDISVQ